MTQEKCVYSTFGKSALGSKQELVFGQNQQKLAQPTFGACSTSGAQHLPSRDAREPPDWRDRPPHTRRSWRCRRYAPGQFNF